MRRIKLFAGTASKELAEKVASNLGYPLGKVEKIIFSDGEFQPIFGENIRGRDVYIIQSTNPPFDNWGELFFMVDAAKRASANKIICIVPYLGLCRQDRKDRPRVGIPSKLMADFLTISGVTRVVSMDIHSDQIQGFYNIPFDHLLGDYVFWPYIKKMIDDGILKNLKFASPDNGGTKRTKRYSEKFETDFVICWKHRSKPNAVDELLLMGEVNGNDIIIVDDMGDTLTTLVKASDLMLSRGANTVRGLITHPVLSGKAYENLEKSKLTELIVLDTIPLKQTSSKITQLSCSELLAKAIKKIDTNKSLSSLFLK